MIHLCHFSEYRTNLTEMTLEPNCGLFPLDCNRENLRAETCYGLLIMELTTEISIGVEQTLELLSETIRPRDLVLDLDH